METTSAKGLTLFFDADERQAAELVRHACEKSVQLVHKCWEVDTPKDCRVYVMTSWFQFFFHAAPWHWRVLLAALLPLWSFRARRIWPYAGGMAQQFGKRRVIGVKPPRLLQLGDKSMGERMFVKIDDMDTKVQLITCHELTHAFTSHLKLPMWLNEGLAQITSDEFLGKPTVRLDTLQALTSSSRETDPGRYRKARVSDPDALVYHYVRGYWITRYIQDTHPDLLKSLFTRRYPHKALETRVAAAFGMSYEEFWTKIDGMVVSHFEENINE
ncbi:MAG: hypothetical protein GY832_34755 [Chloroflexi bacterium]|nr:hypothetical protein [Chloroflexota bacterium]